MSSSTLCLGLLSLLYSSPSKKQSIAYLYGLINLTLPSPLQLIPSALLQGVYGCQGIIEGRSPNPDFVRTILDCLALICLHNPHRPCFLPVLAQQNKTVMVSFDSRTRILSFAQCAGFAYGCAIHIFSFLEQSHPCKRLHRTIMFTVPNSALLHTIAMA